MRHTICFVTFRLILVLCLCAFPAYGWQGAAEPFAFAIRAGTELLVPDQNASEKNAVVKTFSKAICPGNKVFDVRYVGHQSSGKKDSGRATSRNFENVAGSVFHIVDGKVNADEACLLAPDAYIKDKRLLPLKVAVKQDQPVSALRCDAQTQGGLVRQQGRAPVACWQLAQIDPDGRLLAVLYEPNGKDLLAGLVLESRKKTSVYAMRARGDGASACRS